MGPAVAAPRAQRIDVMQSRPDPNTPQRDLPDPLFPVIMQPQPPPHGVRLPHNRRSALLVTDWNGMHTQVPTQTSTGRLYSLNAEISSGDASKDRRHTHKRVHMRMRVGVGLEQDADRTRKAGVAPPPPQVDSHRAEGVLREGGRVKAGEVFRSGLPGVNAGLGFEPAWDVRVGPGTPCSQVLRRPLGVSPTPARAMLHTKSSSGRIWRGKISHRAVGHKG